MKVVKTDGGILEIAPSDPHAFDGLNVSFAELDCATEDALIEECGDASALLVLREPITARVLDALNDLRVVARFGVGVDSIDIPAATERSVRVTNVPDANAGEVAAHALAMTLSLLRRLPRLDASIRRGEWSYLNAGRGMRRLSSLELGVVGFGRIGRILSAHAAALGFRVLAFDPAVVPAEMEALGVYPVGLDELLARADAVSLHVPLTEETRALIDSNAIARMKPGAVLVNTSRGGLVDEDALAAALRGGHLAGAALDAFEVEPLPTDSPLRSCNDVILTPHAAHYAEESYRETIEKAFADVARVLRGEEPVYAVN